VRVTDNGTPSLSASRDVQIFVNRAPVLAAIPDQAVDELTLLTFTASATEPDSGQSVSYSLAPGAPSGASIQASTGVFTWTPTEAQGPGVYNITVRATDNDAHLPLADAKTFQVTVAEVNVAPTLASIAPKSAVAGSTLTFTAVGSDVDVPAQTLTYSLEADAPAGASIHPTTGVFSWDVPAAPSASLFTLTVRVTDSGTPPLSATRVVQIYVDRPPVLAAIPDQTVAEQTLLTFTASASDPDAGQTLTFSLAPGAPSGASIHPSTGVFTWTPTESQGPGTYNITVRVTDNAVLGALSDAKTFSVTVNEVNLAPTLAAISAKAVVAGNVVTFTASATDADLPAQTLTYSLDADAPAGATIHPTTGAFSWTTPANPEATPVLFTVRVTDNGTPALSATRSVVVHLNRPPALAALPDRVVDERTLLTFAASAADPDAGQTLTYSLAPGAPSGASIHPNTGVFTWTPSEAQGPGSYNLTVRVTDNGPLNALTDAKSFNVQVNDVNSAPIITSVGSKTIGAGNELTFTVAASDSDIPVQSLTFSLDPGAPAGASIDPATGFFRWNVPLTTPSGPVPVTVRVTDNGTPPLASTQVVTITVDNDGPILSNLKFANSGLVDGATIVRSGQFSVQATDSSGVSRVVFLVQRVSDGATVLNATDLNGADGYSAIWGVNALPDGAYQLTVTGYDSYGISSVLTRSLTLSLAVPLAPVITSPANNSATSRSLLTVRGTAPAETEVSLFLGGVRVPPAVPVGSSGEFTTTVTLQEGDNDLRAVATNRAGDSPSSANVRVLLDSTIPAPPTGLEVLAYEGGRLRVQWRPPAGVSVGSYAVYRSTSPFTDPAAATRLAAAVTALGYDDFPQPDGTYYYALTTTNTAGTTGSLSACVSGSVDRTAPIATSIVFTHRDPTRYRAPRYGQGFVDVVLNLSEPASSTPFLSVTPPGSAPLPIELTKVNDTRYTGVLILTTATTSGTGAVTFSARDAAGNRGSTIQSGGTIEIDTTGPDLTSLVVLSPAVPIKNDPSPASLAVRVQLSEAPLGSPTLKYRLSSSHPTPTALTLTPGGDARTFEASFLLPANAGQTAPEDLSFEFAATDDLQNTSTRIAASVANRYLVYQGALPDLPPPAGLVATGRAGGVIELAWSKVNDAAGYRLYRSSVNGTTLTALADLDDPNTVTTTDTPGVDGTYRYAIATKRSANGQTSEGAQSSPSVSATADSVAPGRPVNLLSNLAGNGVQLAWQPPAEAGPFKYRIYRAASAIASTSGLTPIASNVSVTAVTDPFPTPAQPYYAITTLDAVGNESIPSESTYLNASLLPVSSLSITQLDGEKPLVQWTPPPGTFVGYHLYVGAGASRVRLNGSTPVTGTSFVDTGFPTGGERLYTVTVVDQAGVESAGRSLLLPQASLALAPDAVVRRGLMNALFFSVVDGSATDLAGSKLSVNVGGVTSLSPTFTAVAGAATLQKVVVGGYASLTGNSAPLEARLIVTPNVGETVQLVRSLTVPVTDGGLDLQVLPGSFVRGGNGQLQFQLTNASAEPIEIVVARNFGTQPSDRTRLRLTTAEGNSLATATIQLNSGLNVVTLANGTSVIRIPGGAQFTSEALTIAVPASAPLNLFAQVEVDKVYYHLGQADSVELNGPTARVPVSLTEVSYGASIAAASPAVSNGDQNVTISGQALDRLAGTPVPNVPVKIGILLNGFERTAQVTTNSAGAFAYVFRPLPGEAGIYSVYATHPELNGRQIQKTFSINRVTVDPQTVRLRVPRNYPYDINLTARAIGGTTATNLRLEYVAADQTPSGTFLPGLVITPTAPINLGPGESGGLGFRFLADNTANGTGSLRVRVASDESGTTGWSMVNVTYELVTATPVLGYSPTLLDTGVNPGGAVTENIRLSNIGLAAFSNVRLSLLQQTAPNTYAPAPAWITLTVPAAQGGLALGESRDVGINLQPPSSVPLGDYFFVLRVESATAPAVNIPIHVAMTSGVKGNVIFKVLDLYTGEPDPAYVPPGTADHPTPTFSGVRGATVTLQNVATPSFTRTVTTNGYGEADFRDSHEPLPGYGLPAGRYRYRITADRHDPVTGQIDIRPGVTSTESVPMNMQLVSIEFSVVPINLQDRYNIILSATFETHVPAPVVVVNPGFLNIPQMCAGDVYQGEFTITNYGLVRADNVRIPNLPSDQYFQFELLDAVPSSIGAGEVITIPYRLRCLSPLAGNCPTAPAAGARPNTEGLQPVTNSGGGAPCSYSACIQVPYEYVCANGLRFTGTATYCAGYSACPPGTPTVYTGPNGPGGPWPGGNGGPSGLSGTFTSPCCEDKDKKSPTGSSVNRVSGKYSDEVTDLRGFAIGTTFEVTRVWTGSEWKFNRFFSDLVFAADGATALFLGNTFTKSGTNYVSGTTTIVPKAGGGWRLDDSVTTLFREFNDRGWMTAFGVGARLQATIEYRAGASGDVAFIRDHNGTAALTFTYDGSSRLQRVTSAEGGEVTYNYTGANLTSVQDVTLGLTTTYGYDAQKRLTSKVFPDGHERRITYHPNLGYVTSVLDENNRGKTFEFSYNSATREYYSKVTTTSGKVTESYFDSKSNEKRVDVNGVTVLKILRGDNSEEASDGRGNRAVRTVSDAGRVSTTLNPDGTAYKREYDRTTGALVKETNERGVVTTYEYGPYGMTRSVAAFGTPQARTTVVAYDALGRVASSTVLGGPVQDSVGNVVTGPDGQAIILPDAVTTYEYDDFRRLVAIVDPEGHRTRGVYDQRGNLIKQIDGNNHETVYEYDPVTQRQTKQTTPGGKSTTFTYDNLGRIKTTTDALNKTITMSYVGQRVIATGPDGAQAFTEMDLDGRIVRAVDAEGVEVRYEYDIHGRRVKQTDGAGNVVTTAYDALTTSYEGGGQDLVAQITTPAFTVDNFYGPGNKLTRKVMRYTGGGETTVDYTTQDVARAVQVSTNSLGERSTTELDRYGNQTSTSVALASGGDYRRNFVYDSRGNLLQLIDANGQTIYLEYDRADRLVKKTLANGSVQTWTYDAADKPTQSVDALGRKTELIWNSDGRITTQNIYPTPSSTTPIRTIAFTYDDVGRLLTATSGTTGLAYTYDDNGRVLTETTTYGPGLTMSHAFTYQKNDLVKTYTGPDGITYSYTYAGGKNLATISAADLGSITYNEFFWYAPRRVSYPGGVTREVVYGGPMKPQSITFRGPGGNEVVKETYAFDAVGQLLQRTTLDGVTNYGYDAMGQLVSVNSLVSGVPSQTFAYDRAFNRTAVSGVPSITYQAGNQIATFGTESFGHDANGDLTTRVDANGTTTYVYGPQQELTEIRRDGVTVATYAYDVLGRRLWKDVGGVRTYFHWVGNALVAEAQVDGGGQLTVTRSYGYRPNQPDGLEPIFLREGGNYYFYANDHLGTPVALLSSNGTVVWSARYEAFGRLAATGSAALTNNLRGSNQYFDAESGLHYNLQRYYDPVLGRYLQSDPLGVRGDINNYAFANNAPLQMVDPEGTQAQSCDCPPPPPPPICVSAKVEFELGKKEFPGPPIPFLGITKTKFTLSAKISAEAKTCWAPCPGCDGKRGLSIEAKGTLSGGLSGGGSSAEFKAFGVDLKGGVMISASGELSLSLAISKPACKDAEACVEGEFSFSPSFKIGGGADGSVKEGATGPLARYVGTKVKVGVFGSLSGSAKGKCKLCLPLSFSCDPIKVCVKGEIYAEAKIIYEKKYGKKGEEKTTESVDLGYRWDILKGEYCF
ncbi:MAG: putative Ig domain-containing protein, partial [Verrucomicrobia bacterium]|nr:putative Ig domain-containing protein [Verrucomicrobiota bacterium]